MLMVDLCVLLFIDVDDNYAIAQVKEYFSKRIEQQGINNVRYIAVKRINTAPVNINPTFLLLQDYPPHIHVNVFRFNL